MAKREELLNWARAFDEQDLSVKAYCAEAGVSTTKFYYWRRQLAEEPVADAGFTSLSISQDTVPGLVLRLPGGVEIACEDLDQDRFIELAVELDRQYAQL